MCLICCIKYFGISFIPGSHSYTLCTFGTIPVYFMVIRYKKESSYIHIFIHFFVHVLAPISFLFFIFCTECFKTKLCCYFCRDFLIFLCKISYSFYQTGFYRILEVIIKLDIIIIFPLIGYLKRRNLK